MHGLLPFHKEDFRKEGVMRCFVFGCCWLLAISCADNRERAGTARPDLAMPMAPLTFPVVCQVDDNCRPNQLCIRSSCTDIHEDLAACTAARVLFEKDSAEIGPNGRQLLMRTARCIKANQKMSVTISGGADSTGPAAYNQELGDRRASAVAAFLLNQGIPRTQLETISFGENLPLCWTQDAACMAKNRRASVRTTTPR